MVAFQCLGCLAVNLAPHWRIHHDAACQHASFLMSEDFLLRLKPVIKWASTDASFVVFEGSCGNLFVERCRHGRCGRIRIRSAGGSLAHCLRLSRLLRFHGFPPM